MYAILEFRLPVFTFCCIAIFCTVYQGECSLFNVQPRNTTVKYGEIAQFQCQVHMEHSQDIHLHFGNSIVYPTTVERFSILDQREFSVTVSQCTNCLQNQTVAAVWILVNSKTLPIIEPFFCRVFHNLTFEDSSKASIQVLYPECTFLALQSNVFLVTSALINMSLTLRTSEVPITSASISEPVTNSIPPCSVGNVRSNKLAISICASLALVMLTLLTVTYVCICIQQRKQLLRVKSSKLSRDQACTNMVDNPIYESDGPVYDSVQPQFNSLTSQVTTAMNTWTEIKLHGLESSGSLQQLTDKNRYVSQPSLSQSGSFSFIGHSNDPPTTNGQIALQDEHRCSHCTTNVNNNVIEDTNKCGEMLQPRRISCSSLSGGWDEQDPKDIRKDNINS